jgi:hypothetical protein
MDRRQFDNRYVTNNILMVGINPNAITLGVTKTVLNNSELTAGLEYNFATTAKGVGTSDGVSLRTVFGTFSL